MPFFFGSGLLLTGVRQPQGDSELRDNVKVALLLTMKQEELPLPLALVVPNGREGNSGVSRSILVCFWKLPASSNSICFTKKAQ